MVAGFENSIFEKNVKFMIFREHFYSNPFAIYDKKPICKKCKIVF